MNDRLRRHLDIAEIAENIGYVGEPINPSNFKGPWPELTLDKDLLRECLLSNARDFAIAGHKIFKGGDGKELKTRSVLNSTAGPLDLTCTYKNPREFAVKLDFKMPKIVRNTSGQNEKTSIASFNLFYYGSVFLLRHRLISPPYREMGLGKIFLEANEEFLRTWAEREGEEQTVWINTCQLSVMVWLFNNGYLPSTFDEDKFNYILAYRKGDKPEIVMSSTDFTARDYWMKIKDKLDMTDLRVVFSKAFQSKRPEAEIESLADGVKGAVLEEVSL